MGARPRALPERGALIGSKCQKNSVNVAHASSVSVRNRRFRRCSRRIAAEGGQRLNVCADLLERWLGVPSQVGPRVRSRPGLDRSKLQLCQMLQQLDKVLCEITVTARSLGL